MPEVSVDTSVVEDGTGSPAGGGDVAPSEMEATELPQPFVGGEEPGMGGERQGQVDIFISYRISPDERLATALKKLLEGAMEPRPSVFVASAGGITPSNIGFRGQISTAARSASVFIGIITKQSKSREWMFFEAGAAWGRDALYAPLMFDVTPEELPSTVGEYQATRATNADDVRLLVESIANRTQRALRERFTNRYLPFGKIAEAYPNEVEEDSKPSIERLWYCFWGGKYDEAEMVYEKLLSAAQDDREKASLRVAAIIFDSRNSTSARREKLDGIPGSLRAVSPHYYFQRALVESREYMALRYYQACLTLNPNEVHRRGAIAALAQGLYRRGEVSKAVEILQQLVLSASGEDRTAGAWVQARLRTDVSAVTKFSLLAVAICGTPEEQHFRAICELAVELGWRAMACYLAERYEQEISTGTAHNQRGIASSNADLPNLGYEAYAKAASKGISVAKVNMSSLQATQGIAAAGLTILSSHEGPFDAATPSYPFSVRTRMEDTVSKERTKLERLIERGRVQFQLWLEAVETAINTPRTTAPLKELTLSAGSFAVSIETNTLLATQATQGAASEEMTFQGDELVPGLYTMSIANRGVHLLAQDGAGWLSVVVASAVDDGDPVTVHRTPTPTPTPTPPPTTSPIVSPAADQPASRD